MQKQNHKRITALTAILTFALVAIIGAGATLAYLTDRDTTSTVTYTINPDAKLEITLDEPIWNQGNKAQPGFFSPSITGEPRAIFSPERKLVKDPQVTVEEGSVDCYIRLQVRVDKDLATLIECPPKPFAGWELKTTNPVYVENGAYLEYYYYYTKIMKQNQTTPRAFDYIQFKSPRKDGVDPDAAFADSEEDVAQGKYGNRDIIVKAQAIQADPFDTWEQVAWEDSSNYWYGGGQ